MLREFFASFRQTSSSNGASGSRNGGGSRHAGERDDPTPPEPRPHAGDADRGASDGDRDRREWSNGVTERLGILQGTLDSLRHELRAASGTGDHGRAIIDRLEAENRALKSRVSERPQEPLIKGVISLFDDLRSVTRHAQSQAARDAGPPTHLLESLRVFERQALEVLRRSDVEAFEPGIADPFDANRQEAWDTVETASPDQEMRIAEVVRLGFELGGRVIRPAAVKVHRCRTAVSAGGNR